MLRCLLEKRLMSSTEMPAFSFRVNAIAKVVHDEAVIEKCAS